MVVLLRPGPSSPMLCSSCKRTSQNKSGMPRAILLSAHTPAPPIHTNTNLCGISLLTSSLLCMGFMRYLSIIAILSVGQCVRPVAECNLAGSVSVDPLAHYRLNFLVWIQTQIISSWTVMFGLRADGYSRRLWNLEGGPPFRYMLCLKKLPVFCMYESHFRSIAHFRHAWWWSLRAKQQLEMIHKAEPSCKNVCKFINIHKHL